MKQKLNIRQQQYFKLRLKIFSFKVTERTVLTNPIVELN